MQPHQNFMYGGVQSPYANGRFQGPPFGYMQRGRMPPPQGQMFRNGPVMNGGNPQQQQQQHGGMGRSIGGGGVLPSLQGSHMMPVGRVPVSPGSSGSVGPMPMPPTSPSGNYMRRPPGPVRPPQAMGYPAGFNQRGLGMNGGPVFQNGNNANMMLNERQNSGGLPGSRAEMHVMKPQGAGTGNGGSGRPMGSSLPLLPGMGDMQPKYSMPPHMLPHHFAPNSNANNSSNNNSSGGGVGVLYGAGGVDQHNGSSGSVSNAHTYHHNNNNNNNSNGSVGNDFNDGEIFTIKVDEDELERKMREEDVLLSVAAFNDGQNGCNLNTPPMVASDDEAGLTPTPPTLRYLTSYEEQEVKEYMPNVYFGGTDQCKKINAVRGTDNNDGFDDDNFHYRVVIGDHLLYRYEVLKVLGQGTFGIVVRAMDHKLHAPVAIKIIKNKPNYTKQAQEEIKTLELLNSDDPEDEANIVQLLDSCIFRNHYLLVFELLPSDLYALIQANKFRPMSRDFIYELSEQLLTALVHVRKHQIVHCDLKPENIMISEGDGGSSEPADFALKLIDFGSACEESRPLFTYIQSRYYRAPEIVLGIPYTTAIDMWSFGCVLCELANGYPIFPASSEGELLERIVEYFGPIPPYLVHQGRRAERFFEGDKMKYNLGKKRAPHPPNSRSLHNFLKVGISNEDRLFEDFVACCLHLDAKERLTPEAALEHPWMEQWRSCSTGSGLSDLSDSSVIEN